MPGSEGAVVAAIGPEGGTLAHPSGARIVLPDGALSVTTELTLREIPAPPAEALAGTVVGKAFEAGPAGLSFLKPVELVLPFDVARLPPGSGATGVRIETAPHGAAAFVSLDTRVDLAAGTLHTSTVRLGQFVPTQDANPIIITTPPSLPPAMVGVAYAHQLEAAGGAPPYTWSLHTGSTVPPGLGLATTGLLSGTPEAPPNAFLLNVIATDSAGRSAEKALSLQVRPSENPAPTLVSISPSSAQPGSASLTMTLKGTGFAPGGQAYFDATALATTVLGDTTAQATIPASLLQTARSASVTFVNPPPGGGTSAALTFTISSQAPAGVTCRTKRLQLNCTVVEDVEQNVKFWPVVYPNPGGTLGGAIATSSSGIQDFFLAQDPQFIGNEAQTKYTGVGLLPGEGVATIDRSGDQITVTVSVRRGSLPNCTGPEPRIDVVCSGSTTLSAGP